MEKVTKSVAGILMTALLVASCSKGLERSSFEKFEITDAGGESFEAAAYVPQGYDRSNTYPVIYVADGALFSQKGFIHRTDSLIENRIISPVVIACAFGINDRTDVFTDAFIPAVEKKFSVMSDRDGRYFLGIGGSADMGMALSMTRPELIHEYWCISPENADVSSYGMLKEKVSYAICWGAKEESAKSFDFYPALTQSIRKRGGSVRSWTFGSDLGAGEWEEAFIRMLEESFPFE
ncbi:MAG: hypothetical protein MJY65_03280 [Bacteroidaceae bacterium]|nr:hypothetical protein [Bacteroidaceae bacterium]